MLLFATFFFALLVTSITASDCISLPQVSIDLDLHPLFRYSQLALDFKPNILLFFNYLFSTQKYQFALSKLNLMLSKKGQQYVQNFFGNEFYFECVSVAIAIQRTPIEVIAFNYMYELGAVKDFCTSIPFTRIKKTENELSIKTDRNMNYEIEYESNFLGRNLDYGYQKYLTKNSLLIHYYRNGNLVFSCAGHAALIGCHTAIRYSHYSLSLNQRQTPNISLFSNPCESAPYTIRKALQLDDPLPYLISVNNCARAYYVLNKANGINLVIQKALEKSHDGVFFGQQHQTNIRFMVQTNSDYQQDLDGRKGAAVNKIEQYLHSQNIQFQGSEEQDIRTIKKILMQSPNKNQLTLMTVILNTRSNFIDACVWIQQTANTSFIK